VTAYSVADAKNRLPTPIDKALAGEEVIITRRGKPVVELRPASRRTLPAKGAHEWLRAAPDACTSRSRDASTLRSSLSTGA
jgi:prevent-host-death family protein